MEKHFGISLHKKNDGLALTRENYITESQKGSFTRGKNYNDSLWDEFYGRCLKNFDLNMKYFSTLSHNDFNSKLYEFLLKHPEFHEIFDLNIVKEVPGYYLMILDSYCQAYIGTTKNIKSRIMQHWNKKKDLGRIIFGTVENSILAIDSFRALDTTRIYVMPNSNQYSFENTLINDFPENEKYLLNRTAGGYFEGGLGEAFKKGRFRNLT